MKIPLSNKNIIKLIREEMKKQIKEYFSEALNYMSEKIILLEKDYSKIRSKQKQIKEKFSRLKTELIFLDKKVKGNEESLKKSVKINYLQKVTNRDITSIQNKLKDLENFSEKNFKLKSSIISNEVNTKKNINNLKNLESQINNLNKELRNSKSLISSQNEDNFTSRRNFSSFKKYDKNSNLKLTIENMKNVKNNVNLSYLKSSHSSRMKKNNIMKFDFEKNMLKNDKNELNMNLDRSPCSSKLKNDENILKFDFENFLPENNFLGFHNQLKKNSKKLRNFGIANYSKLKFN